MIPDLDRAGAVLPGRNLAFEVGVRERVILDVDGEVSLRRGHGHSLRHRPAREDAVALEPEVVVQPPRSVALDDEAEPRPSTTVSERLGRALRVALAAIVGEGHGRIIADRPRRLTPST